MITPIAGLCGERTAVPTAVIVLVLSSLPRIFSREGTAWSPMRATNSERRARDLPAIDDVVIGDLRNLDQTRTLATQINRLGTFDVFIHNAGEYGISNAEILNANSLSPYRLTNLVIAPREMPVSLTSNLHLGGELKLDVLRTGGSGVTDDDSKLHMATLATPGWVPTVMGFHNGPYAPDDLRAGYMTQVWLAEGIEPASRITGEFLFHQEPEARVHPAVHDPQAQDDLLDA